jgi:hypothetical protein
MADKKAAPAPKMSFDSFEIIFILALAVGIFSIIANWVTKNNDSIMSFYNSATFFLINAFAKYVVFALFLSIGLIILIVVYIIRENEIRQKIMSKVIPTTGEIKVSLDSSFVENKKWKIVEEHIGSDDANKWKLAVLEADIILSELLDNLNLTGESIGEKLKSVESSDFDHIEEAWEAHKIRNAIAHQGSDFLLTQREAKRVIKLYESVFREFEIIY